MISRVVVKNFKSIGEAGVDLELKPLTLLVGPNGGGKSSILEAIAVASQRGPTGRLTQFPSPDSLLHKPNGGTWTIDVIAPGVASDPKPGFRVEFGGGAGGVNVGGLTPVPNLTEAANRVIVELDQKAFIISSVRGNVPYTIDTRTEPKWVGVNGENLLLLLGIIFGQIKYRDVAHQIRGWASRFGIGELHAGPRGSNRAGSDYEDTELRAVVDLALASSGARQVLTIITQLFWAPPGSLLMIEEPEISLHPQAQIDVLEMFAEAIKEQKQIIATTHSLILLQALGYAVFKGWLTREEMAVYHVEKKKGGTTAKLLPLDKKGYIRNWVPSFTKVERHLLREWAKTLPRA